MKDLKVWLIVIFIFLGAAVSARAEEFVLMNGDKITGTLKAVEGRQAVIETEMLGRLSVLLEHIQSPALEPQEMEGKDEEPLWEKSVSFGYVQSGGNTEKSQGTLGLKASYKTDHDEWSFKGDAYYSSSEKRMDGRKFYGMGRYAYSFGQERKWYHFAKLEGDQDRFANIDYRIAPTTGVGYWFFEEKDFKLMAEIGTGVEYTNYRDNTDSTTQAILTPRAFVEKRLHDKLKVTGDVTLYPSLEEFGDYRMHSETALVSDLGEGLALKVSFIDDYNSTPSGSAEKNDYKFITSIDYSF